MVEALELVEMYCDLLIARFGLISNMKELDEGLSEAVASLIWVAPRIQSDIQVIVLLNLANVYLMYKVNLIYNTHIQIS